MEELSRNIIKLIFYVRYTHVEEPAANIPTSHHDFKLGDKVTCMKVNHVARIPKMTESLPPDCVGRTDGHSTDNSSVASDRFFGVASEGIFCFFFFFSLICFK